MNTESQSAGTSRGLWSGKALFVISIWGASFVATRIALESFTPTGLVALRLVAAAAILIPVWLWAGRRVAPTRADWLLCLFLGLVLVAHQLLQALGLQYTSAINAGWIIGFTPVPIALGGLLFLKQRLASAGWLGVVVATGGILLIVVSATPGFAQARTGDGLQVLSTLTWAIYTLAAARVVGRLGALRVSAVAAMVGAVLLAAATPWTGLLHASPTLRTVSAAAFLGLICSGLGYYLWYKALDEHGAARVGSYLYLEPFVTVIVAWLLLSEPITIPVVGGGLLVLAGVWAVARGSSPARATVTAGDGARARAGPRLLAGGD
jgi:drug/metabolite transporter (DMT)-like permease